VPTVLCDSGPLIALAKVGRLRLLLDLWGIVHVTEEVYREAVAVGHALGAPDALSIRLFWQKHKLPVIAVPDRVVAAYQPAITLDPGERATFVYAMTLKDVLVLVDDEDARTEARRLSLPVRGTIGILVEAHRRALLKLPEIELLFNEISARPDIWISAKLCARVLKSLRSE
jgi:predicted nucleic acid-binding protein